MKINGKKVKAGKDGYVIGKWSMVNGQWSMNIEFGMSLREEATKDEPSRVALMYGPIVLGGRLADVAHPFSDPTKHNDYYTFNYGKHADVKLGKVMHHGGLKWSMVLATPHSQRENGECSMNIQPFYDLQHCRYVVYWRK